MTMTAYKYGKPVMVAGTPGAAYSAGDVVVQGNLALVAHVDNPAFGVTPVEDSLAAGGGVYTVLADAAYPNGTYVYWNPATQQVTASPTGSTVPFGFIVGGPAGQWSDGGPTGAGIACDVKHEPDGAAVSLPRVSSANALTAHAGGGQANATPVVTQIARFTTVATVADSGLLPAAAPGLEVTVINAAANSMNVFPNTGDAINALGANTAFALAGGKTATFFSAVAGQWHSILSS